MLDIEQLILLVHQRKELFDASHPKHHDREVIATSWREIAEELNISDDVAKSKWRNLRSNYLRERRNLMKKSLDADSGAIGSAPKWPFYSLLQFLDNYTTPKGTSALKDAHDDIVSNEEYDSQLSDSITTQFEEQPPVATVMQPHCSVKYSPRKVAKNEEVDWLQLGQINKMTTKIEEERDPDRMFLLSLLPLVKQLSPIKKLDFKSEVFLMLKGKLYPQTSKESNKNGQP